MLNCYDFLEIPSAFEFLKLSKTKVVFNEQKGKQIIMDGIPLWFIDLCHLLNGNYKLKEIYKILNYKFNNSIEIYCLKNIINQLNDRGFITKSLKKRFKEKFPSKNLYFKRFQSTIENLDLFKNNGYDGVDFIERLMKSRVTVVGLGGNGSLASVMLAAGGVGQLRLIDGDRVESTNLVRQIFYNEYQAKTKCFKVDALKSHIQGVNPYCKIEAIKLYVSSYKQLESLIIDSDFVLLTADKPRMLINEWLYKACHRLKISGMASQNGLLGPLYRPGNNNPFENLKKIMNTDLNGNYNKIVKALQIKRHRDYPSFVTGPINIGQLQANEVFAELTKAWEPVSLQKALFINQTQYQSIDLRTKCK
jgi:molybdopterin/thiamine biosynthesis adenylyltransferase